MKLIIEPDEKEKPDAKEQMTSSVLNYYKSFDWQEFVCGFGSAVANITITYPMYKLIFRQMLHGYKFNSAYNQLKNEGFNYLYRGMMPPLAQKGIALSIMFGIYDGSKKIFINDLKVNQYKAKIAAGMVAGSCETILMPFERVQTLLAYEKFHQHFRNTQHAFRYVWVNHGFLELFRGFVPIILRNGLSNALFFVMREEASSRLPKKTSQARKIAQEFIAGAVLGATISTIFYPLNVIKVSMQSDMGYKSQSVLEVFKKIYTERNKNLRNFYRGAALNASRSFISWGIVNTSYEICKDLFMLRLVKN